MRRLVWQGRWPINGSRRGFRKARLIFEISRPAIPGHCRGRHIYLRLTTLLRVWTAAPIRVISKLAAAPSAGGESTGCVGTARLIGSLGVADVGWGNKTRRGCITRTRPFVCVRLSPFPMNQRGTNLAMTGSPLACDQRVKSGAIRLAAAPPAALLF